MTSGQKKEHSLILQRIRSKAFHRQVRRKKIQKKNRVQYHVPYDGLPVPRKLRRTEATIRQHNIERSVKDYANTKNRYIEKYLPPNLKYLITTKESPFYFEKLIRQRFNSNGVVKVPKIFSIIEDPINGYLTLCKVISALLYEPTEGTFELDYEGCEKVELGSQILLDIILKDFMKFSSICLRIDRGQRKFFPVTVGGNNINKEEVRKLIFSVGSPVTLNGNGHKYPDIIPYKLCIHDNEKERDLDRRMEQKELDTTEMADYVLNCLTRMNKVLTPEKLDDLCTVIGEILINAEEHSSTKYRFSIGYFKEYNVDDKHYGIFRLVILNFGQTIYEKFKSEDCPNKEIVSKMQELSESYTTRKLFRQREFEEENLWTLYALQEGVSSVSPKEYKRGNGSIRFIESFFNIKGSLEADDISSMTILSGNTSVIFDGKYEIQTKINANNETFRVMTFNESGNIEEKPDNRSVCQRDQYFPGTLISAKILLNDDDLIQLEN